MAELSAAEWLRNEHKIVAGLTGKVLRVIATVPQGDRDAWLMDLRRDFGRLRVHLKNHMAAEEVDGFLSPVVERRPTLAPEVQHLKDEHAELEQWLDAIWDEITGVKPGDQLLLEDACQRMAHFISALRHHEEREALLVTFVFSQDIGGRN